jgi:ribosome-binding protein aMBF1 (putative translation factor)
MTTTRKKNPFIGETIQVYAQERSARDPEFAIVFKGAQDRRALARALREAREAKHLSQAELARRLGTKQTAIARIESGKFNPRLDNLRAILAALGYALNIQIVPLHAKTARA